MAYQDDNAAAITRWVEDGFRLTHVYEDTNGTGNLHDHGIPSFWATRAVKEA